MAAFKTDESFLEKISMGATGTRKVLEDLGSHGHRPIELERFSTNFKIWKTIKIKRIRVPDILCLRCAHRVESRAKKDGFEMSMSHSLSDAERGWDFGLTDRDYVAIVVCERSGERPIDWRALAPVQYLAVSALRAAHKEGQTRVVKPKGAQEGFEIRLIWPAAAATASGVVTEVAPTRIRYQPEGDARSKTVQLRRKSLQLIPLVRPAETILEHQILAASVPVVRSFVCEPRASADDYIRALNSASISDRYAAAKALSHFPSPRAMQAVERKLRDEQDHIYVRLECAAGLAKAGNETGWRFVEACLEDEYLQHRLEAVIVLAEIGGERSARKLTAVIRDRTQNPEIRAGAAWAIGELTEREGLDVLIECFSETDPLLRVEAARALAKLTPKFPREVIGAFPAVSDKQRPGLAWALSQAGTFEISDLLHALTSEDARQWTAYVIGTQQQARMLAEIELLRERDAEVYFAVTVLWKIVTSWVYQLETYG